MQTNRRPSGNFAQTARGLPAERGELSVNVHDAG